MKKLTSLILTLAIMLLAGCGGSETHPDSTPEPQVFQSAGSRWTLESVTPSVDLSFSAAPHMKTRDGKLYFVAQESVEGSFALESAGLYEYDPATHTTTRLDRHDEYVSVVDFAFDSDGGFVLLYSVAPTAAEAQITTAIGTKSKKLSNSVLERMDASGNSLWQYNITKTLWDSGDGTAAKLNAEEIAVIGDMVVCINSVSAYDEDGNQDGNCDESVFAITFDEQRLDMPVQKVNIGSTHNLVQIGDKPYLMNYYTPYCSTALDFDSMKYGGEVTISIPEHNQSGMSGLFFSGDEKLLFRNSVGIWSADPVTGETEYLLNWLENDLSVDIITGLCWLDQQLVYVDGNSGNINFLTKNEGEDQRTAVTLGTLYLDSAMRQAVLEFNQSNEKYRIEVVDYSQYGDAGQDKLNMDISGDNMPDIIEISDIPYATISGAKAKGALLDLSQFTSDRLDLSDYIPSLLDALRESDGALYELVTGFSLATFAGHNGDFSEGETLTWSKLQKLGSDLGSGQKLMEGDAEIGLTLLMMDSDSFLDWENGSCNYENEEFHAAFEVIKEELSATSALHVHDDGGSAFRDGDIALSALELGGLAHYADYMNQLGEDAVVVGLPSAESCAAAFIPSCRLAVSSKTENLDAVLELLQFMLESQSSRQFSALETNFESMLVQAMTPLEDQPECASVNGLTITLVTGEQADRLRSLVSTASRVYTFDTAIYGILSDELNDFIADKSDISTAAQRVQSRVSTYLSERG